MDGQYGTGAVIVDLVGFSFVMLGKDYTVLDRESSPSHLHLPADQQFSRSESDLVLSRSCRTRSVAQWVWNLHLELGHHLQPLPLRTAEFAPAIRDIPEAEAKLAPVQGYGTAFVAVHPALSVSLSRLKVCFRAPVVLQISISSY